MVPHDLWNYSCGVCMGLNLALCTGVTVVKLGLFVGLLTVEPVSILVYKLVFEAYSLWWGALLSLDAGERDLVLPQLDVSGFVDSALPFLGSGWVWGDWRRGGEVGAWEGWGTVIGM